MGLGSSPYDPRPPAVCETSNKLLPAPEPPFSHLENGRGTDHISLGCCRDQMSQCVFNFWHRPGPRSPFLGVCCSFWGWAARSCSPAASGIPGWSGPPSSSGQNACFHMSGTWPSWPCWSPEMAVDAPELCDGVCGPQSLAYVLLPPRLTWHPGTSSLCVTGTRR